MVFIVLPMKEFYERLTFKGLKGLRVIVSCLLQNFKPYMILCLCCRPSKIKWYFNCIHVGYVSIGCFKFFHIIDHGFHKTLGMKRGKDYTALNFALGRTGHYIHKVDDKLGMAVRNDGQVCISTFRYFF